MTTLRFKMVEEAIGRKAVEVKAPAERPAEYFGKYVFDRDKMRKYLPKACFETLMNTMKNYGQYQGWLCLAIGREERL